jgi:hypothetical protein
MGLDLLQKSEFGSDYRYWKIESWEVKCRQEIVETYLHGYKDKTASDNEEKFYNKKYYCFDKADVPNDKDPRDYLYSLIKAQGVNEGSDNIDFSVATDVIEK